MKENKALRVSALQTALETEVIAVLDYNDPGSHKNNVQLRNARKERHAEQAGPRRATGEGTQEGARQAKGGAGGGWGGHARPSENSHAPPHISELRHMRNPKL